MKWIQHKKKAKKNMYGSKKKTATLASKKTKESPETPETTMEVGQIAEFLTASAEDWKKLSWYKISAAKKAEKLREFALNFGAEEGWSEERCQELVKFLNDAMSEGKLQKSKDILYSKETQKITNIPSLQIAANGTFRLIMRP